jgi:predicted ATP-dependent endonuclease of OLD family
MDKWEGQMKLKSVKVSKYKSILQEQVVNIEDKITTLVGMNESGKTVFLESLAKINYFEDDLKFKFDKINDYPRNELKKYEKSGIIADVVTCNFEIEDSLFREIEEVEGIGSISGNKVTYTVDYDNSVKVGMPTTSFSKNIEHRFKDEVLTELSVEEIMKFKTVAELEDFVATVTNTDDKTLVTNFINEIKNIGITSWNSDFSSYIYMKWIKPNLPKFWYYDEYYELPSKININELNTATVVNEKDKTAKALFELADINTQALVQSTNYEEFVAELEATSNEITTQLFEYWTSNTNLDVRFHIEQRGGVKFLDIRIWNNKYKISLPLSNRSKGFNWFFSFIVWFSKIQADSNSNYILLLDEPGLNLHASAQGDLLRFLNDLSERYQVIFTTHSPFMIDSASLYRVRTVLDSDYGTTILESIIENDQKTLFPLQAALGYDIAQNLFVSKYNLLVEGPADLLYLSTMSNHLESLDMTGLDEKITIVPVGGLDKVVTFISLLSSSKLKIACLLDTFNNQKGKQRVDDLIKTKIIKQNNILTFDLFLKDNKFADIEDIFEKDEYIDMFNKTFDDFEDVKLSEMPTKERIIDQINSVIPKKRFNHYKPSLHLSKCDLSEQKISMDTLLRFEDIFKNINNLF